MGRTRRHFTTRVDEHLNSDYSSSIFRHLNSNPQCKRSVTAKDFTIKAYANSMYELAVKEGLYINWLKPNLNKQKAHEVITLLC